MICLVTGLVAIAISTSVNALAQPGDAEVKQLVQQYQSAWNKGDVKALAALYAQNAIRMRPDAEPLVGRPAIEQMFTENFAGMWKGTKLALTTGRTPTVTADVRLIEGTFEVTGGAEGPQRGRYLNTLVREGGQWKLAAVVPVLETAPAKR